MENYKCKNAKGIAIMKKPFIFFATVLLALFFASCSNGNDDSPITYPANEGPLEGFDKNPGTAINYDTKKPYTAGSGKIYMADEYDNMGHVVLTNETMVLVGTMNNGEITFDLPSTVDSRFLREMDNVPAGMKVEPLGAKMWFYNEYLIVIDDSGQHIADMLYLKRDDTKTHKVHYCYFSEAVKISGWEGTGEGEGTPTEFRINAKKGWNKIYMQHDSESKSALVTTDLSQIPSGLEWVIREIED